MPPNDPRPPRYTTPFIRWVDAPRVVRHGEPIAVEVGADQQTPGHRFLGCLLEAEDLGSTKQGRHRLVLRLALRSQVPDNAQAQVLVPIKVTAKLFDVPVGRHEIDVQGWTGPDGSRPVVEVVPASLVAKLSVRGGFAGVNQSTELFAHGVARLTQKDGSVRFAEVSPDAIDALRQRIDALPAESRTARTQGAADLFEYEFGAWRESTWIELHVDDIAATPAEREVLQSLRSM
jgi:hypothetical protein